MIQKLGGFTSVQDLSFGTIRLFAFDVAGCQVYVAWSEEAGEYDLHTALGDSALDITPIVTQLDPGGGPYVIPPYIASSSSVPLSETPVFLEIP